jgi:UDP-N-acetylmuramate: L-alanyl-gamma-D-glutamyl-meso-diaminopimelate ligase
MNVHFIAIGGAAMHNLALAMHQTGHAVTGSDDEIFEPSKGRLAAAGLLPETMGWNPDRLTKTIDAVILGMHARIDNPELLKAQEMGLRVYSYPEFIYERSLDKTRVVIAGSHGKTTITSMILHVLKKLGRDFDYLVGAQIEGFDTMVRLSDAPIIILEGDEYLSSPIDRRPKFHLYHPQIALISGIAWDHINVFPTWEIYKEQFSLFIDNLEAGAHLAYCSADETLSEMTIKHGSEVHAHAYETPPHKIENGRTIILDGGEYAISVFGDHNLQNMNGARIVSESLGIDKALFYNTISDFTGASRRLEIIREIADAAVYKDFAHSPSKLSATVSAVKKQWPDRTLIAAMELHTFSSLTKEFLKEYDGSMNDADEAIVFYKEETIAHKKLDPISIQEVVASFGRENLIVFTTTDELQKHLMAKTWKDSNLLLMSSGNFGGMNVDEFGASLLD